MPQCDFCNSTEISWRYRASSFECPTTLTVRGITHTFPWGSIGDWAACDDCSELIETGQWDTLARKSVSTNPLLPMLYPAEVAEIVKATEHLFQKFVENRIGPRMHGWAMP